MFTRVGDLVEGYMERYECGFDEAIEMMRQDLEAVAEDEELKKIIS